MLKYVDLKARAKDLLAATGLTVSEFEALLPVFAETYQTRYGGEQTVVEHSLSGVKPARSVQAVLRNTKAGFSDLLMEVACALHHLRVDARPPIPTLDLTALAT